MTKKDDYQEPTSHSLGGDNLEDISGGVQPMPGECNLGDKAKHQESCNAGYMASEGCVSGNGVSGSFCSMGDTARGGQCTRGRTVNS